ncbi:MAG: Yip1 family protein [Vitreimonas sp.]
MTTTPTSASSSGLIDRAKNILLTPKAEWDRIAAEPADTNKMYMGYLLPLLVLGAVCAFIGMSLIGISFFGNTYRTPMIAGLVAGAFRIVSGFVGVYAMAFVANMLAPNFGSTQNMDNAQKLAVYGSTAGLLAGVFAIFPPLAILAIVGLYSLVLLYYGLGPMMKTPDDKKMGYFITIIVVCIVIGIVISVVSGMVLAMVGGVPGMPTAGMLPSAPK